MRGELFFMATQDERLATVEKGLATFQRETVLKIHETNENATMLLGLVYKQGIEIKSIHERLDTMDIRLDTMGNSLDAMDNRLDTMDTRLDTVEHRLGTIENTLSEHTSLLTQILERLPK